MSRFIVGVGKFLATLAMVVLPYSVADAASRAIRVGVTGTPSDVGLYLAEENGFFRQEGLSILQVEITSPADMLEALKKGGIDVGGGVIAPAFYNASAGKSFKIVADKGSVAPPNYHYSLLVRAEHVLSGRFQSLRDLKGMRIGVAPFNLNNSAARLSAILGASELKWDDVKPVEVGLSQFLMPFSRNELDAAIVTEPMASFVVERGQAKRIAAADQVYAHQQISGLFYSTAFIGQRRGDGEKFMRAYLRGVRMFNDALIAGRLTGPNSEAVIATLMNSTAVRNFEMLRRLTLLTSHPDGELNMESLDRDLSFFKARKWVENPSIKIEDVVDRSFADKAARDLGRAGSLISRYKGWNDG